MFVSIRVCKGVRKADSRWYNRSGWIWFRDGVAGMKRLSLAKLWIRLEVDEKSFFLWGTNKERIDGMYVGGHSVRQDANTADQKKVFYPQAEFWRKTLFC